MTEKPSYRSCTQLSNEDSPICNSNQSKLEDCRNLVTRDPQFRMAPQKWVDLQIETLPDCYPLERTNQIIRNDQLTTLEQLKLNLSECFRKMSIQAKYRSKPAGAALLTPELIEMHLYLWRVKAGELCIEIQRRQGDSYTFHRYANLILATVSSGILESANYEHRINPHRVDNIPIERSLAVPLSLERQEALQNSVEMAANLINSDRIDSRVLGMESLCMLTDYRKTCLNNSLFVSRSVAFGKNRCSNSDDTLNIHTKTIHEFILKIFQSRDENTLFNDIVDISECDSDDDDDAGFCFDDNEIKVRGPKYRCIERLRYCGLQTLANAWETIALFDPMACRQFGNVEQNIHSNDLIKANDVDIVDHFCESSFETTQEDIILVLLTEVKCATSKPHHAFFAAKCLHVLCQKSIKIRKRINQMSGIKIITSANEIGTATNLRLQKQCEKLLLGLYAEESH